MTHGERSFRIESATAADELDRMLDLLADHTAPGETVFVGPANLARTNYSDTFVYYLLPELRPASFYTELNPGTANADDSTLASELSGADAVLLTERHDTADTEVAAEAGSSAARRIVERNFCRAGAAGSYSLYLRTCVG